MLKKLNRYGSAFLVALVFIRGSLKFVSKSEKKFLNNSTLHQRIIYPDLVKANPSLATMEEFQSSLESLVILRQKC